MSDQTGGTDMEADRDFCHGMAMLSAARRCENWTGDDLTMERLARLASDYRTRATGLMIGSGAAQPEQANRTPTDARDEGATPRAIRNV